MIDSSALLAYLLDAHGGAVRWSQLTGIDAVLSARGFLFATKHVAPLRHVHVRAQTEVPRIDFYDWPRAGWRGEWHGDTEVRLVAPDGVVTASRKHPRDAFGWRREFWWDDLDFLYFAGYATWNYLTAPFLFQSPGFRFEVLPGLTQGQQRLVVHFPDNVPSHCRRQVFHLALNGEIDRLDYTAEVVGRWAHAAHLCSGYRECDGLRMPTTRRVYPLFHRSQPLPWPTLVALDVHEFRGIERSA